VRSDQVDRALGADRLPFRSERETAASDPPLTWSAPAAALFAAPLINSMMATPCRDSSLRDRWRASRLKQSRECFTVLKEHQRSEERRFSGFVRADDCDQAEKSAMAGLSKAKLRSYLLEHTTVPDKAWNAAYGAPAREDGENRETYIRRMLV
jgi:hypothetical protein